MLYHDHVFVDALVQLPGGVVLVDIDVIVLDGPEESLGPDIVQRLTSAIHRNPDVVLFKQADVIRIGEVTALIAVHDLRYAVAESTFQAGHDEAFFQCARQLVIHDAAAVPVDDDEAS